MGTVLGVTDVVLVGLLFASLWLALYQVVKQQGRLLLRLDELERRGGVPQTTGASAPHMRSQHAQPAGLPVGTAIPPFGLPDLKGNIVRLDDFKNERVLLINWSPQCGYCGQIAPELARLEQNFDRHRVALVLVSNGDADANQRLMKEHGLRCRVLLQNESLRWEPFRSLGTPVAYLLDEHGRVAEPLAVGAEAVPTLAREATSAGRKRLPGERPLSESQILRDGLKAGTPAPSFRLPDLDGRIVSLDDYRGRSVLLIFTDPQCGPCDQLAAQLAGLRGKHRVDGPAILMVGRGDAEENRRKAKRLKLQIPIVLQDHWKLSLEFGIFATPVAFLIDGSGVIARAVAKGKDEILAVARDAIGAA
jgi:peroxiredoxin